MNKYKIYLKQKSKTINAQCWATGGDGRWIIFYISEQPIAIFSVYNVIGIEKL